MRLVSTGMVVLLSAAAQAQSPTLDPGARVRLDLGGPALFEGTLLRATRDSLVVSGAGGTSRLPRARVASMQVETRSRALGAAKGAQWGVLAGIAIGYFATARSGGDRGLQAGRPLEVAIVATEVAIVGTVLGALIGADRWITVDPGR